MTPFGAKIRKLRIRRGVSQKEMAAGLGVSAAYLSALEHGNRGKPTAGLVMQICDYFDLIWDQCEDLKRLAELSHPRVTIDTAGLQPQATELANLLAQRIDELDDQTLEWILDEIKGALGRSEREPGPTF